MHTGTFSADGQACRVVNLSAITQGPDFVFIVDARTNKPNPDYLYIGFSRILPGVG